jgi:uncharacterized membrane protein YhaH (DUF805 family)
MTKKLSDILRLFIGLLYSVWKLLLLLLILFVIAVIIIRLCDNKSCGEALHLAFITFLTIGYGDIHPNTVLAKIVCIFLGFLGICFMGIIVAAIIKAFEKAR